MRLAKARITNFKSVLDSDWFTFDDLTCLVGKNESGKTAILEGLEKLKSVRSERQALKTTEYPRMNWSEYEEGGGNDIAIAAVFELNEGELARLAEIAGDADLLTDTNITVEKRYDNELSWILPFNLGAVIAHAIDASSLTADEKVALGSPSTSTALMKSLRDVPDPSQRQVALLAELEKRWPAGGAQPTAWGYLKNQLPSFVYYSQYDRLPGRVSLEQLIQAEASNTLENMQGAPVFMALLSMVGSTPQQINDIATSEELISKLEAVQTRLSRKIFKYWSQNKHLKVRFRFDQASPGDPAPYNSGKVFQTRIENTRHEATIRLDERSTGFIWFFSFLVWFSEVQKQYGDNLIVLLDEPGLTLHARAQADLLRYFQDELLPKYQLIYTTHSPFMIDAGNLTSCRTVEDATGSDEEVLGTKVGDKVLSTDGDTLFPLQAALGYDLTQTLFVGEHSLLVEGPSDLLYLQWASNQLKAKKREGLDVRWTITPCGGITKIPSFLALFGGNKVHVAVLTDYGAGDKKKVREVRESALLREGHVFTADQFAADSGASEADVEDILGRDLYRSVVTQAYSLPLKHQLPKTAPCGASPRIVEEAAKHFMTLPTTVQEFDHYAPSRYLLENAANFEGPSVDDALDRFEQLFNALNQLL